MHGYVQGYLLPCSVQWFPPIIWEKTVPRARGNLISWVTGQLCTSGLVD